MIVWSLDLRERELHPQEDYEKTLDPKIPYLSALVSLANYT